MTAPRTQQVSIDPLLNDPRSTSVAKKVEAPRRPAPQEHTAEHECGNHERQIESGHEAEGLFRHRRRTTGKDECAHMPSHTIERPTATKKKYPPIIAKISGEMKAVPWVMIHVSSCESQYYMNIT
jgi:hypothetical protein